VFYSERFFCVHLIAVCLEALTAHAFLYPLFLKCTFHSVDIAAAGTVVWQLTEELVSHQMSLAARYEQQLIVTPSREEYL
jgi:hypothetical protein